MIYKIILPLLIGLLWNTEISAQDTISTERSDSIVIEEYGGYDDSAKVKKDCSDIKMEQRVINNEVKRQLDVLNEFLNRGEEEDPYQDEKE